MSLKEQIKSETIAAMRNKDKNRLGTIRLLSAEIKQKEVDSRQEDCDNQAQIDVVEVLLQTIQDIVSITEHLDRKGFLPFRQGCS